MLSIALLIFLARLSLQWCTGWNRLVLIVATVIALSTPIDSTFRPGRASAEERFGDRNAYGQSRRLDQKRNTGILADSSVNLPKQQEHLREGTLIPPTSGRFVMLGRRWAFVPTSVDEEWDANSATPSGGIRFDSPRRRSGSRPAAAGLPAAILSADGLPALGQRDPSPAPQLPQLLVVENLMLQRIVEAVRADQADDRWTISGSVIEFFDENRLVIRTAQRASSF